MTDAEVQPQLTELERLRAEVEAHRQRELAELRSALAVARAEATHYRQEAERNAEIGRKIHTEAQGTIADLRAQLSNIKNGATREIFYGNKRTGSNS